MKFLILPALVCLFIVGCSSSSKKSDSAQTPQDEVISPEIQQEFGWIENSDFVEEQTMAYNPADDKFEGSLSSADSLSQESIARLPAPKIEDAIDSNDIVTKLAGLCHARKFSEAFQVVQKVHRKYRKHPAFWNQVGTCHLGKRDYRSAILFYNKSRELDSKYAPPLNNLGVIYQSRGSIQKAYLAYKEAAKLNPLSLTPIFNLAQLQLFGGQVEDALVAFQALVKRNDDDNDALAGFATALLIRGDTAQAVRVYDRLSDEAKQNPSYGTNFALAQKLSGDENGARSTISRIASTPDQNLIAYYNKVKSFVYQGSNQ
tara:strand:- start:3945 stop:4895 length:951 start_codon:yes stop_codon:yes gene_type:complete